MKFIGFLKTEDKNIRGGLELNELINQNISEPDIRSKVLQYLNEGVFLTGIMSFLYDNDGQPIGNLDYFTDGELIWPIYYRYYLAKYESVSIDQELIRYASNNIQINISNKR